MDQYCSVVCRISSLNKAQAKAFNSKISDEYRVNMCVVGVVLLCSAAALLLVVGSICIRVPGAWEPVWQQQSASRQLRMLRRRPALSSSRPSPAPACLNVCGARRILDNLPIGMVRMRDDDGEQVKTYERGFPVGFTDVS